MFQTLIVGLGRSGRGLHLPVLSRARAMPAAKHLFDDRPIVAFDPWGTQAQLPGAVLARSLAQAGEMAGPDRTVVHLCSLPATRVEVLEQLARLGFQKIVVEKPLAVDEQDLVDIARLRQQWDLDLVVVAPWLASALTHRILQILRGGELGTLRSVFVIQRKPRFTRSLMGCGHPTAFDVEMPHSVGVALAIAGNANVCNARLTDMRFEDVVVPRLGSAWLSLDHESGVSTEICSDLTSPTRERRITLELEQGTLIGHYPNSEADHTAQLSTTASGRETRSVFHDDALTTFMLRTYQHFAAPGHGSDDLTLNAEVVRLLSEAKRLCIASSQVGPACSPTSTTETDRGNVLSEQATPGRPTVAPPAIAYAGIGDEAGASLRTQMDALARLGWSWIELRTVDGTAIADLGNRAFTRLADALAAQGLTVAGVASRIGNWSRPITGAFDRDLDELAILTHRCAALGTRYIRVMSYLNASLDEREWGRRAVSRLRELASRAERAGLVLLHENCTGWAATSAERMLALLDAAGSPALRLLFDTGNGIAYGYQAYDMLADILPHVAHVHVKDAHGSAASPGYVLPGAGQARVADCLRLLLRSGYTGAWSLEPHLTLRPHAGDEAGQGRHDGFVASGRALEQLVRDQVLPAFPAWTAIPGGLSHG